MRRLFFSTIVLLTLSSYGFAQEGKTYYAIDASKHVGEVATIVGEVANVRQAESGHVLINLDAAYPNEHFTVFVPKETADQLGNAKKLEGHKIAITGKIALYRDRPEIVVND